MIFSFLFVVIDQVMKAVLANCVPLGREIEVIPNFFYIANVHNDGAAWSMLSGNVWFLSIIGMIAIILIYTCFIKGKSLGKVEVLLYSLLIGGILGNLIDRILLGYVVDYLGFILFGYYYPIFNFADIGIVVSVLFLIVLSIKEEWECKKSK